MHNQAEADVAELDDVDCIREAEPEHEHEPAGQTAARRNPRHAEIQKFLSTVKNLVVRRVSDVNVLPARWLWPGRIPLGHLTILAGDSGSGKSLLSLDLAARVSRGAPWPDAPDAPQEPGNVLVLTAHDAPALVGRPRLERAGANLDRVFFATGMPREKEMSSVMKRQIRLPDDLLPLSKIIYERSPMPLVVLDPAWVFCSRGKGRSKLAGPAQLAELAEMAAQLQVAIVCVSDLRRESRGLGAFRTGGDRALNAAAQAGWGIVRHPQQQDQRLLLPLKMNLGRPSPGLEFKIAEGRIEWEAGPSKLTAESVIAAEHGIDMPGAEQWLLNFLANGGQPVKEIIEHGRECGYSEKTLRRAKTALGAQADRHGFKKGEAYFTWSLKDMAGNDALENVAIYAK